jgi:hypothetical protein
VSYPEGIFSNTTVESARSKLIDGCSSRGIMVQESQWKPSFVQETEWKEARGSSWQKCLSEITTIPQHLSKKFDFTIYPLNSDVKVTAQQWIESQMAFGTLRRRGVK